MKQFSLFLVLLFAGSVIAQADTATYVIKFRGTITSLSRPVTKTRIKETNLVTTNGNLLVYEIDVTNRVFSIFEADPTGANTFNQATHSDNAAVSVTNRKVVFDIHDSNGFDSNVGSVPVFFGRLLATGRITPAAGTAKKIRFVVTGVWNEEDDTVFKGVITGTRLQLP